MTESKSKLYTLNSKGEEGSGKKYSFSFDKDSNLIGISESVSIRRGRASRTVPVDPSSDLFTNLSTSDAALDAMNVNKFKGKTTQTAMQIASTEELTKAYNDKTKKHNNASAIEQKKEKSIAPASAKGFYDTYGRGGFSGSDIMSYPLDLNLKQDHFKIMKYNYQRSDVNASKPPRKEFRNSQTLSKGNRSSRTRSREYFNVAGDGVVGSQLLGSVQLPMPKATDVNGVEWGKSDLTVSGLAAVGAANLATLNGRLSGKTSEERKTDNDAKEAIKRGINETGSSFKEGFGAVYTGTIAKMAGAMFGTDLDANTFLARQGGKVLNPNSEMLFQGPVIRDFAFSFLMVARSQKEGDEIRKIIRFLKLGMAPKFRSTTYLKNPDIFVLEYRRADGGLLDTVNRFNPGGLALTTMSVDYAPNGYWSAYHDSQPVALKMDLNFTELRPIYEQDQIMTPESSVGY